MAIATLGGVGRAPVAPGTVASAVTALALGLVPARNASVGVALVIVVLLGTWAADRAERVLGGKDPGAIVIDEVAGMMLSVLFFPRTPAVLASGFVLFRIFDVVKPPPAGASQRLPGGIGVMIDDVLAALYAALALGVARTVVGWP